MSELSTYQKRMQIKKKYIDRQITTSQQQKGVLMLLKGNGKGKSTAAFGTLARALGHHQQAAVIQFVKARETGESIFFKAHKSVEFYTLGAGFTWETQDLARDKSAAENAWQTAKKFLTNEQYQLVILDEMTYPIKAKHLDVHEIVLVLQQRPSSQNVIITGRTMPIQLESIADTISNIEAQRHAFDHGIKAQAGVDF